MSELWGAFVSQLQDSCITATDIFESLLSINELEPEIIKQSIDALKKMRPEIADEVMHLYKNATKK